MQENRTSAIRARGVPRVAMVILMAALILSAGPADARIYRFRCMVVVGDSILAGFGSGGLLARGDTGQRDDAAALLARQARVRLLQPLMSGPGVPPPLGIDDANGDGQLDPGDVRRNSSDVVGFRRDVDSSVRNLMRHHDGTAAARSEAPPGRPA